MNLTRRSWIAFVSYALSITFIVIGPWDWWVNSLVVGVLWAVTFPRRNARRQGYSFREFYADHKASSLIFDAGLLIAEVILWPITVPVGGWWILPEIYGKNRTKKKDTAS